MFGSVGSVQLQASQQIFKRKVNKIKRRKIGDKGESQSQSYQPDVHQIKKHGLPTKQSKHSSGSWNLQENRLYLTFIQENRVDFQTEKNRRKTKVFFRLSKVLKRRTPDQCRSHHQKLQIKYNDQLSRIMEAVQQKIDEEAGNQLNQQGASKSRELMSCKRTAPTTETNDDEQSLLVRVFVDFNQLANW